jgi:hypothetical protein
LEKISKKFGEKRIDLQLELEIVGKKHLMLFQKNELYDLIKWKINDEKMKMILK